MWFAVDMDHLDILFHVPKVGVDEQFVSLYIFIVLFTYL